MKLISFTVPCFNSEAYMRKCIDSVLSGGDDVEVIIVNDGSKDGTLAIANEYKEKYPDIVKVIDKENGGHGSGLNAGLKESTGLYFKVVDSDDWVDESALKELISTIKRHIEEGQTPDLYITNFIYNKADIGKKHVSEYTDKLPTNKIIPWDKIKSFKFSRMLLMHALMYKREKLIESDTVLPEHTFYVDNFFAYKPLPFMKTVCYIDVDLYNYYIGRDDQSINRKNFSKRYEQQIRVMKCMIDSFDMQEINAMSKGLRKYMWHALVVIMMNTIYFTCVECDKKRKADLKDLWRYIKNRDKKMYGKLRHRSYTTIINYLPWRLRGFVMGVGYDILCKKIKLG